MHHSIGYDFCQETNVHLRKSILAGKKFFRFLPGDLTGIALCHDLNILIAELVEQVEDAGNGKADGGDQF